MRLDRLAIVGLGSIGRRHFRLIKELRPDLEVILVRSGSGEIRPEEELASCTVYSISEAVKKNIQAAIISSPASVHLEQAVELATAGVHLLIEKPLSHVLNGIDGLSELRMNRKIVVMTGYVLRYDPGARKIKDWLAEEQVGELLHARIECGSYLPDWRPEQNFRNTVSASSELGGGVLLELSHELDYLHWFFGKPTDVQARLGNSGTLGLKVEDQVDLIMSDGCGRPITVQLDFSRRFPMRMCTVQTTEGQLSWDAIAKKVIWKPADGDPVVDEFMFDRDFIYRKQLERFLDCVENNAEPGVSLQDGINVMELVDAVRRADSSGRKILL